MHQLLIITTGTKDYFWLLNHLEERIYSMSHMCVSKKPEPIIIPKTTLEQKKVYNQHGFYRLLYTKRTEWHYEKNLPHSKDTIIIIVVTAKLMYIQVS